MSVCMYVVPEGCEAGAADGGGGAGGVAGAQRREARPPQDTGHRGWVRARELRPESVTLLLRPACPVLL